MDSLIALSEADLILITQNCGFVPDVPSLYSSYPILYLLKQIRLLRQVRFESVKFSSLLDSLTALEHQASNALLNELRLGGAITREQKIDPVVLAKLCCSAVSPLSRLNKKENQKSERS